MRVKRLILIPSRGAMTHEATRKVIGEFLTQIDGLKEHGGITVIASTNTPEAVDKAFLSRMTQWVEVPAPDKDGIAQILIYILIKQVKRRGELLSPIIWIM